MPKRILFLLTTLSLLIVGIPYTSQVSAADSSYPSITGPLSKEVTVSTATTLGSYDIVDASISGNACGVQVSATVSTTNGTLSAVSSGSSTVSGSPGASLTIEGSIADVEASLSAMTVSSNSTGNATVSVSVKPKSSFTANSKDYVFSSSNGHYYQRFDHGTDVTWPTARSNSLSQNFCGLGGYLATITSDEERTGISGLTNIGTDNVWLAGVRSSNPADPSATLCQESSCFWYWDPGSNAPLSEQKMRFAYGDINYAGDASVSRPPWQTGEPNDSGPYLHSYYTGGSFGWDDLAATSTNRYSLIEFGQTTSFTPSTTSTSVSFVSDQKEVRFGSVTASAGVASNLGISLNNFSTAEQAENYQVTVRFVDSSGNQITNGILTVVTTTGLGLVSGYTSYSGSALGFKGSYTNLANAVSSITWTPASAVEDIRLKVDVGTSPGNNQFFDPASGRYYEYVSTTRTWDQAKCYAKWTDANYASSCSGSIRRTLFGLNGYLAHITSKDENDFIANYTSAPSIWIGATDSASEGQWKWDGETIAGENIVFGTYPTEPAGSTKDSTPTSTATGYEANAWYPGRVAGWASGEPNDWSGNEDCAVTNWSGGKGAWNDLGCSGSNAYLIEYGGAGGTSTAISVSSSGLFDAVATSPTAPTITSITSGNGQLTVAFSAPSSNGGASITTYKYSLNGASFIARETGSTASPIIISGLTNGTSYSVKIVAVNSEGDGAESNSVSSTPRTNPLPPSSISATSANAQITLTWDPPNDGGSPITDYVIEFSLDGTTWTIFDDGTNANTSVVVTGLTNGSNYLFRITSVNIVGSSTVSSSVSATPANPVVDDGAWKIQPTPSPTPTPTPSPTRSQLITPTVQPTPPTNPLPSPSPTPTNQSTPQSGSPTNPAPLVQRAIEEIVDTLKPVAFDVLVDLITKAIDEIRSGTQNALVLLLDEETAKNLVNSTNSIVLNTPTAVLKNGVAEPARIVVVDTSQLQVVAGEGGLLSLEAKEGEDSVPVDSQGRLQMIVGNSVEAEGTGFRGNTEFAVWLFSDPTLLGVGKTDAAGRFFASFPVENEIPIGDHTLQVVGTASSGEQRSIALPVIVLEDKETAIANSIDNVIEVAENPVQRWFNSLNYLFLLLILLFLIGIWAIWATRREYRDRKRELDVSESEQNSSFAPPSEFELENKVETKKLPRKK